MPLTRTAKRRELDKIEQSIPRTESEKILEKIRQDGSQTMKLAGMTPDPWQERMLRSPFGMQMLINASRQSGKSQAGAALALREALTRPPALILVVCPAERQSQELFQEKLLPLYDKLPPTVPMTVRNVFSCRFANGSRIVALPGKEATIRSFSAVSLLLIDESARVIDPLYDAVRPMLAVSGGGLVAMSTPWGKRGWWHKSWEEGRGWQRIRVPATMCPRIDPGYLDAERQERGDRFFSQEFMCEFTSTIDAVYSEDMIQSLFTEEVKPLFA